MRNFPTVTKNLLLINILCFFGSIVVAKYGIDLNDLCGLHFFLASKFKLYQIITYMFLHEGFSHIFFNMFALWMFGRILENIWGPKRFLILYMVCGIGAGLMQEGVQYIEYATTLSNYSTVNIGSSIISMSEYLNYMTTVGASGAVYGILIAFGVLLPNEKLFIIPIPIPIKAKYFVAGYAILELGLGLLNSSGDNVAHFAHVGGMLFGLILVLYWKRKDKKNGNYYF